MGADLICHVVTDKCQPNGILSPDWARNDAYSLEIPGRHHDPDAGGGVHPPDHGRRIEISSQGTSPLDLIPSHSSVILATEPGEMIVWFRE